MSDTIPLEQSLPDNEHPYCCIGCGDVFMTTWGTCSSCSPGFPTQRIRIAPLEGSLASIAGSEDLARRIIEQFEKQYQHGHQVDKRTDFARNLATMIRQAIIEDNNR